MNNEQREASRMAHYEHMARQLIFDLNAKGYKAIKFKDDKTIEYSFELNGSNGYESLEKDDTLQNLAKFLEKNDMKLVYDDSGNVKKISFINEDREFEMDVK